MARHGLTPFCMVATPFASDGSVDEAALRANLRRMVEAGNGVYLGSGGAGEGHALTRDELGLVYRIGVEECRGRVPVHANPPEARTALALIETAGAAAAAGVDVVQLYQLDAGHGMRPTEAEQERYYRDVLDAVDHPTALSVHVNAGYAPPVRLFGRLCRDHGTIVAVNVIGMPSSYQVELQDELGPKIALHTRLVNALEGIALGARGCLSAENNLIPHMCRRILDRHAAGDIDAAGRALADVIRVTSIVNRWAPSTARWIKMGMKVLDLPGAAGGLRAPYLMPPPADLAAMAAAFDRLDLSRREAEAAGR